MPDKPMITARERSRWGQGARDTVSGSLFFIVCPLESVFWRESRSGCVSILLGDGGARTWSARVGGKRGRKVGEFSLGGCADFLVAAAGRHY